MEVITNQQKIFKNVASVLGIVQGTTWVVLSIICLSLHYNPVEPHPETWTEIVGYLINMFYLQDNKRFYSRQILEANGFLVFCWGHLFLDAFWVLSSLALLRTKSKTISNYMKVWTANAGFVCLLDFLLVAILSQDLHECKKNGHFRQQFADAVLDNDAVCTNGILPVIVISAKGFILWVVNLVFTAMMLRLGKGLVQPNSKDLEADTQIHRMPGTQERY